MRADYVIKGSVLSEKAYGLSAEKNVFTLKVDVKASKKDIANALKTTFGVDVLDINTTIVRGKVYRKMRTKKSAPIEVKKPNFKKAYVRLKPGQVLPTVVPTVESAEPKAETAG